MNVITRKAKYYNNKDIGKSNTIGYVYAREHPAYDTFDACKIGKTKNINRRDGQYATYEIKRGHFAEVFEVPLNSMEAVEKYLKECFVGYRVKINGGVEFYSKHIIPLIEFYLQDFGVVYNKLERNDIVALLVAPKKNVLSLEDKAKKNIPVLKAKAEERLKLFKAEQETQIGGLTVE